MRQESLPMLMEPGAVPVLSKLDARIPGWDGRRLRERACPLCRRAHPPALRRPERLPVNFCPDCSLWYVRQIPPEAEIEALYAGYWSGHRPRRGGSEGARAVREAAAALARSGPRLQRLAALCGTLRGKLVLDVGAGRGEFLAAARLAGAEVMGNDLPAEACGFLERELGILTLRGELARVSWDSAAPDVIVMNGLIEHPIEPLELFSRAVELLKRGGRLLIWTPKGGAAGRDAAAARGWVGFRVDREHMQYFSPGTIQALAAGWGSRIEHLESTRYPGLEGIGRLPAGNRGGGLAAALKRLAKRCAPWRPAAARLARQWRRPRALGTYNLFAILGKP